jgi:DNA-binding beta-propeller fold protein YncE
MSFYIGYFRSGITVLALLALAACNSGVMTPSAPAGPFQPGFASTMLSSHPNWTITTIGGFSLPSGVAVDTAGNLYVADLGHKAIKKVAPSGRITTLASLSRAAVGPFGVAVDTTGNVFFTVSHAVRRIAPNGKISTFRSGFIFAWGIAAALDNAVVVSDIQSGAITKIGASGRAHRLGSSFRFYHPQGVAVGPGGATFVANSGAKNGGEIDKIASHGLMTAVFTKNGSAIGTFTGVALDKARNVWAAYFNDRYVRKFAPNGRLAGWIDSVCLAPFAGGIAIDQRRGTIYVSCYLEGTVKRIAP